MKELISILMSVYNEPVKWVKESVESIINQTYTNIEFIIVIDDPTNKNVIDYLYSVQNTDDRIRLIFNNKNLGLVSSLNKGLKVCKGKYIARMDADDISHLNRIEEQYKTITNEKLDICGCNYECFQEEKILYYSKLCLKDKGIKRNLKIGSGGMAHPTWMLKAEVYEKLAGYRNVDACEDLDFIERAVIYGYKLGNTNDVLFKYRNNNSSISHTKEKAQLSTAYLIGYCYRRNIELNLKDYNEKIKNNKLVISNFRLRLFKLKKRVLIRLFYTLEKISI